MRDWFALFQDAVLVLKNDAELSILELNAGASRLLMMWAPDQSSFLRFLSTETKSQWTAMLNKARPGKSVSLDFQANFPIPLAHRFYSAQLLLNDDKTEVLVVIKDITEQSREKLLKSQIEEKSKIGGWEFNYETQLIHWNVGTHRMLGTEPEKVLPDLTLLRDLLKPDSHRAFARALQQLAVLGKPFEQELAAHTVDGQDLWMLATGVPYYVQGKIIKAIGTFQDVSIFHKEKQARQAVEHSTKMASLGEMASNIAHELNNPLAVIQGRSAGIRRALSQPMNAWDSDKMTRDLTKVEETCERMARIILSLRNFSRSDERDPEQSVNLASLIADTQELCREKFRATEVDLRLPEFSENIMVHCHPTQILQILVNLLGNAIDAVDAQTEKWVQIDAAVTNDQRLHISVTDSGPGIPPAIREKIMNKFFTTKPQGKGTGLGLSISKQIAQRHGGDLRLDPNSQNTRFILELPLKGDKAAASTKQAA